MRSGSKDQDNAGRKLRVRRGEDCWRNDVRKLNGLPRRIVLHGLSEANGVTIQDFTLRVGGFDLWSFAARDIVIS
jgi:hypothetical protein